MLLRDGETLGRLITGNIKKSERVSVRGAVSIHNGVRTQLLGCRIAAGGEEGVFVDADLLPQFAIAMEAEGSQAAIQVWNDAPFEVNAVRIAFGRERGGVERRRLGLQRAVLGKLLPQRGEGVVGLPGRGGIGGRLGAGLA